MSYIVAMKDFFGLRPDQKIAEFQAEVKAVEPWKAEFIKGLELNGYVIKPSPVAA
jgi:hypothetical protein